MKVLARRTHFGLVPCDEQAEQEFARVSAGKPVYVELKAARNPKQHRLLFGLLRLIVDNTEMFPNTDAALVALKIGTGLVDTMITEDGKTVYVPRSISFANMPQNEFAPWFEDAVRLASTRWLQLAPETLRREIEEMLG